MRLKPIPSRKPHLAAIGTPKVRLPLWTKGSEAGDGFRQTGEEQMFRCDNCGSGYSAQAASSWTSCPRCLAKEKVQVPLTFELGWQRQRQRAQAQTPAGGGKTSGSQPALR